MTDGEGSAFPLPETEFASGTTGITKREYFAACALQGLCAVPMRDGEMRNDCRAAVMLADALIAALNEVKP